MARKNEQLAEEQKRADEQREALPKEAQEQLAKAEERRHAAPEAAPVGVDGSPMTPYEANEAARFEDQNEVEARIDEAGADVPRFDAAGNPTTVDAEELLVGSATQTTYPGLQINPYPPTDYGTNVIIIADLTTDPTLGQRGLVAGDPMPPENAVHDLRETDNVNDPKDYSRVFRPVQDAIIAARRDKYPTQVGSFPAVEPPS